ncbi:MAG: iron-sulfur cluster repair di-iron protein [Chloracidobacterium sp.]|nr:iron-sulfur cluster repair di-iron protein [Chloracidobacterium sp.]
MQQILTKTVREIALEAPVTTRIFEEYKIDYCCHGDTLFTDACLKIGADPTDVIEKIDHVIGEGKIDDAGRFADLTLTGLIGHILETHHAFTRSEAERLTPLMEKVESRHSEHHLYLTELKRLFLSLCDELEPHMTKEEMVLFPYIVELEAKSGRGGTNFVPPFGTVKNPVRMMTIEHEEVGEILAKMRSVTSDYQLPADACPSFTALFHRLENLERDLHQHIHLENNLLFPKAIELENAAFARASV